MTSRSHDISYFARTNGREPHQLFGIRQSDRLSHVYVIGKTGTGKSTLLETLIRQDIDSGRGCALLDPHGDLVERIVWTIPEHREGDVVYLNVPDPKLGLGYNPFVHVSPGLRPLIASGLMDVFKKMWTIPGARVWSTSCATLCSLCSINQAPRCLTSCRS